MADPIPSSSWTGPTESMIAPGRTFTHRIGAPSVTGDYARFAEAERARAQIPAELRPILTLAGWLLVSPTSLWVGNLILNWASDDWRVADRNGDLLLWSVAMLMLAGWQLTARSLRLLDLRRLLLSLAIVATVALSAGNVYLGLRSKSETIASTPERTFMHIGSSGRGPLRKTTATFQRADGSFVDGRPAKAPVEYGRICAEVQRLDGPDGYSWVRVRKWSRSPARGELAWPIRREECFSDIPLSTLPR